MSAAKPLLIELGTEELPPKALDELAAAFSRGICDGLAKRGIDAGLDAARTYATPRRLAVYIPDVAAAQPEQTVERRGPAVSAGLDADGQPAKALVGFAQSCGVPVEQLERLETDKGAWFVYRSVRPGQATATLLPELVAEALKALPIPKPMRWADHDYSFVRPVHWLVMLHGSTIVDGDVLGLHSGRKSRGHRFMHPQPIHVVDADSWEYALRAAKVIADPALRRDRVRDEVARAAAATGGFPQLDHALLDEIANLTEWPSAIACTFEREFLAVPPEALVTTMETNQKFVPVFDAEGRLTEHFIGIANIESKDPAEIRKGYERVIRPRFADAKFFWDEDLKTPLAGYQEQLKNVTYQQSLGSLWDKTVRVAELARVVANRVGVDAAEATRAASLAKCDLLTRMVGEFPELQGVMGRYYAAHQGEPAAVATALDSFYQPRFAGDSIAADAVGQVVAVAERLDTLSGIFAVGLKPSGSKDPFALRRAALGLARTLVEAGLEIDLDAAFAEALDLVPDAALQAGLKPGKDDPTTLDPGARRAALKRELHDFVMDRLRGYYAERGFDGLSFDAVLAVSPSSLADLDRRLRAVAEFSRRPEAASLAAANKRVANLLRKQAEENGAVAVGEQVDAARFALPAEHALADALAAAERDNVEAWRQRDYGSVLQRLAQLQPSVDAYFEAVLVNAEDPAVRANRLALLARLQSQFRAVADIALL
ncbi:glycine--tRNA ligase subunit beta [Dyella sp.]|jgi:glycyl-tRNA synthetase beta chain|uniref:glycine--tRNA ligase subunit beta n=1 Tax=Dyella sp. TaxID=1869338 RepID=UPI002D786D22|nr:glycine--tRNA ligase subunit beta [Dyella sp.]HET6434051.1 glycine--tRNA ligase subunit beta [Dyella sp.]